jgi:hypothetical protein
MREVRAVVMGPETAVLVERRLQSLVAEGWTPMGALGCAACAEGLVFVGVFKREVEAEDGATIPAPAPRMTDTTRGEGPACPLCGGRMTRRTRKADGAPFWGCTSFPECRGIVNWRDWTPSEAAPVAGEAEGTGRVQRTALVPTQAPLPGLGSVGTGALGWAGDPEDEIPF